MGLPLTAPGAVAPPPAHIRLHQAETPQEFGLVPAGIWADPDLSFRAKIALGGLMIVARGAGGGIMASIQELAYRCGCDARTIRKGLAELARAKIIDIDEVCRNFRLRFTLRGKPGAHRAQAARTVCAPEVGPPGPPIEEARARNSDSELERETEFAAAACAKGHAASPPPPLELSSSQHPEGDRTDQDASARQIREAGARYRTAGRDRGEPPGVHAEPARPGPTHADLVAKARRIWPDGRDLERRIRELMRHGADKVDLALDLAEARDAETFGFVYRIVSRDWLGAGLDDCRAEVETARGEAGGEPEEEARPKSTALPKEEYDRLMAIARAKRYIP